MSDARMARKAELDVQSSGGDDADESVIADREPRAPQLTRLGRYRLVRELASGGMASVNLAVTEGLDKLVALKLIHPHLAQEEAFVHMFLDEARIASAISHRNVCNTFDFGEAEGRYYIAMDYLAGQSLRDVILRLRKSMVDAEPKRLAVYMAYILAEACEGLHAAHELRGSSGELMNVVHRDVSPHNLFITYDGNVSVVDFGIARASDRIQHTATGVLKGKFSYMAPEQVRQLEVDRRADIWALGVVLWESLTLERLFVRSSQADTLMSVMMDRVRSPSEACPELPKELDPIAQKALARNPQQRYATAREMGRDLMKFCRESGVSVGAVEIEQWMERLFPEEREKSRALVRAAKQAAMEGSSLLEMTPLGFARVPTRSGPMPKAPTGSFRVPTVSLADSGVGVRPPDNDVTPHEASQLTDVRADKKHQRLLVSCIVALAVASGMAWAFPSPSSPSVEPRSAAIVTPRELAAPSTPAEPTPAEPTPAEPTPAEPTPEASNAAPAEPTVASAEESAREAPALSDALVARPLVRPRVAPRVPAANVARAPAAAPPPVAVAAVAGIKPTAVSTSEPSTPVSAAVASAATREIALTPAVVPSAPPESVAKPAPASAVNPPPPKVLDAMVSFGSLDVEGSLGSGVVARMLSRATPLMHTCYVDAAQRAGKNDYSSLAVALTIDETGAVRSVEPAAHPLSGLSRCAGEAMKRLRSERKPDVGTVRVRLNVSFRPK